jgi:hypothetical protein
LKNKSVSFIFCYARSGGTFLNRFLKNIPNVVILSEAHPIHTAMRRKGTVTIANQAKQWYGIEIKSLNYVDQLVEIKEWCDKNDKHLIIRDWSYIDFTPSNLNYYNPINKCINLDILERRFNVKKIAFVRDGIDVFLSRGVSLDEFACPYLNFVQYILDNHMEYIKYEDFCEDYITQYNRMAQILELPYISKETPIRLNNKQVIGDTQLSRGNKSSNIELLDRKHVNIFRRRKINSCECLNRANSLLSYKTEYEGRVIEPMSEKIKLNYQKFLKKLKQNYRSDKFDTRRK